MKNFAVACLCLTAVLCTIQSGAAVPIHRSGVADTSNKCKDLCDLCSCNGLSCGDECICECKFREDRSEFIPERHGLNCKEM